MTANLMTTKINDITTKTHPSCKSRYYASAAASQTCGALQYLQYVCAFICAIIGAFICRDMRQKSLFAYLHLHASDFHTFDTGANNRH